MKFLKSLAAAAATMFVASNAHAVILLSDMVDGIAPIPGEIASVELYSSGVFQTAASGIVTDGADMSVFGVDTYDVNAGPDGTQITADLIGNYTGVFADAPATVEFVFVLPLAPGEVVSNVTVVSTQYAAFIVDWIDNLILFAAVEQSLVEGSWFVLDVEYSSADAAIPVPAAALLFAPAAFLAARRRKAKAA